MKTPCGMLPTKTHSASTPSDQWCDWIDVPFGALFCPNAPQLDAVLLILHKAGIFVASASNRIEHEPESTSMPWYHDLVAFCQTFLPLSKEFMLANTEKVRAKLLEMRKSRGVKPGKQDTADAFCGVVTCDAGEYLLWDDKEDLCAEARTTAHKASLSSRSRSFNRQHDNGELVALLLDCLSPEYIPIANEKVGNNLVFTIAQNNGITQL